MDQLQRITFAQVRLVNLMPFLGHLVLFLKPEISDVKTLQVWPDGRLQLNPAFLEKLSMSELLGCLAHETLHIALNFWGRVKTRDREIFNLAQDHAINLILMDLASPEIQIPLPAAMDRKFSGLSSEEIYEILVNRRRNHTTPLLGFECVDAIGKDDHTDVWRSRVDKAFEINTMSQSKSEIPRNLLREVNHYATIRWEWQDDLFDFIGLHSRRLRRNPLRPSRRSSEDTIPSLTSNAGDVAIIIDTSGSVSKATLSSVLQEIKHISNLIRSPIRIIAADAEVHLDVQTTEVSELVLEGGGGSNLIPAFEKLRQDQFFGGVIAFTDGLTTLPETQPPNIKEIIWVTDNKTASLPWGRVLQVGQS